MQINAMVGDERDADRGGKSYEVEEKKEFCRGEGWVINTNILRSYSATQARRVSKILLIGYSDIFFIGQSSLSRVLIWVGRL